MASLQWGVDDTRRGARGRRDRSRPLPPVPQPARAGGAAQACGPYRGDQARQVAADAGAGHERAVAARSAGGRLLAGYVSSHLGRVNAGTSAAPPAGPLNILLAGVDVRAGLTRRQQRVLHVGHATGHNSDTLMVVHITATHRHIFVISLPRDSWVKIPGFGMNKINAAIGLGGPPLMVRTVEQATGLTINDFVEVNFLGFVKIIDALGGVDICLPYAVNDPYTGLHMP